MMVNEVRSGRVATVPLPANPTFSSNQDVPWNKKVSYQYFIVAFAGNEVFIGGLTFAGPDTLIMMENTYRHYCDAFINGTLFAEMIPKIDALTISDL